MATLAEVNAFLNDFKVKLGIWGVVYIERVNPKNTQTLLLLDMLPAQRTALLKSLKAEDYSQGPIKERMYGGKDMWVFGQTIKGKEIYIKITLGQESSGVICISFHIAERAMDYPLKKSKI